MIPASRQRNYLQSALYIAIAGILAALLLERLLTYAEAFEKAQMEVTLSRLHSALYARLAYYALRGEYGAIEAMRTDSPFAIVEWRPSSYQGELEHGAAAPTSGHWGFDRARGELLYAPRLARHLDAGDEGGAESIIRFRVVLAQTAKFAYTGVAISPVTPYRWTPGQ